MNVDVVGYFTTATTGSTYSVAAKQKVVDTRDTSVMAAKERRKIQVAGQFGVPADATGVLVNVTAASTGTAGNVGLSPAYGTVVGTSTVYFGTGESVANRALVALAPDGTIEVYASSQSHVRIDLVGWFGTGGQSLRYNPVLPGRLVDTRNGTGGVAPLAGGAPAAVAVEGHRGIPADAHAVVGTLTVIRPTVDDQDDDLADGERTARDSGLRSARWRRPGRSRLARAVERRQGGADGGRRAPRTPRWTCSATSADRGRCSGQGCRLARLDLAGDEHPLRRPGPARLRRRWEH